MLKASWEATARGVINVMKGFLILLLVEPPFPTNPPERLPEAPRSLAPSLFLACIPNLSVLVDGGCGDEPHHGARSVYHVRPTGIGIDGVTWKQKNADRYLQKQNCSLFRTTEGSVSPRIGDRV